MEAPFRLRRSHDRNLVHGIPRASRVYKPGFHAPEARTCAVQEIRIKHRWDAINADTEARETAKLEGCRISEPYSTNVQSKIVLSLISPAGTTASQTQASRNSTQ